MGQLESILARHFGYSSFRAQQRSIIERVLAGGHSLVIMPTGGGKSLCFQIPALVLAEQASTAWARRPITLVLSPLIALMKDQVDALVERGIEAAFVNSSLDREMRTRTYQRIAAGHYDLLYVTPERFRKNEFLEAIASREVGLLAIDEAHCISQWGHDFRPDYTRVGDIRRMLGSPTTLALTATATCEVQQDIVAQLGLPSFGTELHECQLFHDGIDRPNLSLDVQDVWGLDEKIDAVRSIVAKWGAGDVQGSGIVYFTLIRSLEEMSEHLHSLGIAHVRYHGELQRGERRRIQEGFMSNACPIVLATNAFGMGIDKEDIRFVVHAEIPGSLESYYQEIGRAGRDGLPSECTLLYDQRDLNTQIEFLRWNNPDADFYQRTYDLLVHERDAVRAYGMEWLRQKLCDRQRHDRRLETVLAMLERYGILDDEHDLSNLSVQAELPLALADESSRRDKHVRDQKKLYALVEYARSIDCKAFINDYFAPIPRSNSTE